MITEIGTPDIISIPQGRTLKSFIGRLLAILLLSSDLKTFMDSSFWYLIPQLTQEELPLSK